MKLHPDMEPFRCEGGMFDVEPCAMDLNIGKRGRFVNLKGMGTIAATETFEIVGVQKNYRGDKCYRVVFESDVHGFGRVAHPDDITIFEEEVK